MAFEQFIRYAGLSVGLMAFEQFIRYAGLSVGLMVFEKFIRYAGLAVGLKPSARGCEGRLRGLCRIISSKTIEAGACPGPKRAWSLGRALCSAPFAPIFRPWPI